MEENIECKENFNLKIFKLLVYVPSNILKHDTDNNMNFVNPNFFFRYWKIKYL